MSAARALLLAATVAVAAACSSDGATAPADPAEAALQRALAASPHAADLAAARAATARYHQVERAIADGYAAASPCVSSPAGAMGVHYVNGALVGDGVLDVARPEVLLYAPERDGRMRLIGVEYMVPQGMWKARHGAALPQLFGQAFEPGPMETYALHAWVWRHNPSGTFAPFNPSVSCPAGGAGAAHAH